MTELRTILNRIRLHLRWQDGCQAVQNTFWMAVLSGLLVHLAGRFLPIQNLLLWSFLPLIIWIFLLSGYIVFHPLSLMQTAKRVDQVLGLRQRLSTALALETIEPGFPIYLITAQQQDALKHARAIQPAKDLPFIWRPKHLLVSFFLSLLLLTSLFLPNPMDDVLAERAAVAAAIEKQADEIVEMQQQIESNQDLSEKDKEELLDQLKELEDALRTNTSDLESAMAALSQLEADLKRKLDPNTVARDENLESLAAQLAQLAGIDSQSDVDSLTNALNALQSLAEQAAEMNAEERSALADQIARLSAQALATGETQLSQSLSDLSQAVTQSDASNAAQAAQQAGDAIRQVQSELAAQEAASQMLQDLQSSRTALAQSASASGNASGSANSNSPSADANPADGNNSSNSGTGASNASGSNAGGGGGTTADRLPPANRTGRADRPEGAAPDAPETQLESQVYAPWARYSTPRDQLFIPGQEGASGETTMIEGQLPLPGTANPSLVPYNQVYFEYLNAFNQAMESSFIPSTLSDYVQAYFLELEP